MFTNHSNDQHLVRDFLVEHWTVVAGYRSRWI
jgi:hypothetical protein